MQQLRFLKKIKFSDQLEMTLKIQKKKFLQR